MLNIHPFTAAAFAALLFTATPAAAQAVRDTARTAGDTTAPIDIEREAKQSRSGAGVRVGAWGARGLPEAGANQELSKSPVLEAYFQSGRDLHLAIENTATVYWEDRVSSTDGVLGPSQSKTRTYVIPLFTSVKAFPFTRPGDRVEPYALAGVGFAFGVEDPDNGSVSLAQGLGVRAGTGLEMRLGRAFGLGVGGRWQWIRFLGDFAGTRTVEGFGADVGVTYRFQYR